MFGKLVDIGFIIIAIIVIGMMGKITYLMTDYANLCGLGPLNYGVEKLEEANPKFEVECYCEAYDGVSSEHPRIEFNDEHTRIIQAGRQPFDWAQFNDSIGLLLQNMSLSDQS